MKNIKVDNIVGSRRLSNYWWATLIFIGGLGFFITGLSSYFNKAFIIFIDNPSIIFLPQGAIMTFYGIIAILVSIFLWYTILLNVGGGYNEFNNETGIITIFRLGFPGKNRVVKLKYGIEEIKSIKIRIDTGISPKREIKLRTKDEREIPITKVGEPIAFSELESKASDLAKFLNINLEGIDKEEIGM